jgi:repressor LexA
MVTEKQKKCLDFIKHFIEVNGYPPTIREIAKGLGVSSPATVKSMIDRLIQKGYVRKNPLKARNIEFVDKNFTGIPLLGTIKAGYPVLSEENIETYINLNLPLKDTSDYFFLKVDGDSMRDKGILEGDFVLIQCIKEISNNQIGAFRINSEVTLKIFIKDGNNIILKAANKDFKDIRILPFDDFEIIGKMIFLIRDSQNLFNKNPNVKANFL